MVTGRKTSANANEMLRPCGGREASLVVLLGDTSESTIHGSSSTIVEM